MPGMDGLTLGREIKSDRALQDTRLVMMTSLGQRGDARRLEAAGFAVYLPKPVRQSELFDGLVAALAAGLPVREPQSVVTRHSVREMRRAGVRLLLAEDNITNQQVAVGILRKLGLHADAVANGREALEALQTIPYDLVLMDVQMPEMDGLQAARAIRDPRTPVLDHQVPIVAMTAHAMQGDREQCLEAGMNDYVSKPVNPQALAEAVERWLPRSPRLARAGAPPAAPQTGPGPAEPPGTDPVPVFNRADLLERLAGDEESVLEIVRDFLQDTPRLIRSLREAVESGDARAAERQAHSIKGAAATVGGAAFSLAAFEVEKAGQAGDLTALNTGLPELVEQFRRLEKAMRGQDA